LVGLLSATAPQLVMGSNFPMRYRRPAVSMR
jgi:hypothetical protein